MPNHENSIVNERYDCELCRNCCHRVSYQNCNGQTVLSCEIGVQDMTNGCGFHKDGQGYSIDCISDIRDELARQKADNHMLSKKFWQFMKIVHKYSSVISTEINYSNLMNDSPNIERIRKAAKIIGGESKAIRKMLDPDGVMKHDK